MICKNCDQEFSGNFCNNCGQKSSTDRINYNYLINEILNTVFQVNHGILFSIKELSIRPGYSIREFLNGKRKKHFKPIAFILLTSTLYVLTTFLIDEKTFLGNAFSGATRALSDNNLEKSITANILNWLSNNFGYSSLFLLPFFSFASYISFINQKYNFFEHLILNCYITGQQTLIYLAFEIIFFILKIDGYYTQAVPFFIAILFVFWTFNQFFETKKTFSKILFTSITYILYVIGTTFFFLIFGIIEIIIRE
ncbi:DUF3667 domain-containing protein [Tenacibaculum aiptasiae]|uniref:DUF3667 domain-containing protein n=1 Tax=Tenacibaculum aiptasiae TaxID=426481 RepID=A0A7J5ALW0_9FLAO|nr:DUF3667 domain-containing protein [Tenacibaculum aiptasiae]KAB1158545.1 DUF3667 domain-containing protein [Tenacibaculum aiptasiae]